MKRRKIDMKIPKTPAEQIALIERLTEKEQKSKSTKSDMIVVIEEEEGMEGLSLSEQIFIERLRAKSNPTPTTESLSPDQSQPTDPILKTNSFPRILLDL